MWCTKTIIVLWILNFSSDILSEMRHALTHKAIPDKKLIVSTINYIIDYLK